MLDIFARVKQNVGKRVTHSMDFRIEDVDGQPRLEWIGEGIACAREAVTIQAGKSRGGCGDSLKALLTVEWQESAGIKGKLLAIGYRIATVGRAVTQLALTHQLEQERRGRLTFWRTAPSATTTL